MSLLISQIRAWNLDAVDNYARTLGDGSDVLHLNVDRAYRTVDAATANWKGKAADAAWDSATLQHSFGLNAVRTISAAQRCVAAQSMNLRYARESLISRVNAAIDDGFSVTDNGRVTATPTRTVGTSPHELKELLEYHYWRIAGSLADINDIDSRAAGELNEITNTSNSLLDHKSDYGIPDALVSNTGPLSPELAVDGLQSDVLLGDSIGPADGFWDIDYSNPLPTPGKIYGPFVDAPLVLDPDTDGRTGAWSASIPLVADPANPDAVVATVEKQYRFRIVGADPTVHQTILVDGKYYPATYYKYQYEVQESVRITNHIEPGLDMPYPGDPSTWSPIPHSDILNLQKEYPDELFYVPS